jgi:hypothetical protein
LRNVLYCPDSVIATYFRHRLWIAASVEIPSNRPVSDIEGTGGP